MQYLLDTNIVICLMKHQHNIPQRIIDAGLANCMVSEITIAELYVGFFKGQNKKQLREVEEVKRLFKVLPISPVIEKYAEIRAYLEQSGKRVDDFDLLIGVTALQNNLTMVTHNTQHFLRIPNLKVEDWQD